MNSLPFHEKTYKTKYICFACRKVYKRMLLADIDPANPVSAAEKQAKCPQCGKIMTAASPKFRVPPEQNLKAWAVLGLLSEIEGSNANGSPFGSSGGGQYVLPNGPVAARKQLELAIAFYESNQRKLMNAPEWIRGDSMRHFGQWLDRAKSILRTL